MQARGWGLLGASAGEVRGEPPLRQSGTTYHTRIIYRTRIARVAFYVRSLTLEELSLGAGFVAQRELL